MQIGRTSGSIVIGLILLVSTASAQPHTQRGAVLGGLSGAAIGAAIGNQNHEATEGALIGGALGLLSGAVIGNSVDAEQARIRDDQYRAQAYRQQQQAAVLSQAISMSDVISLSRSGVSDVVIMNQIRQRGVARRPEVSDVIALHQQGVSESVISAMQQAPLATVQAQPTPVYQQPSPVVVERHYVRPSYYRPRYVYPHHGYGHPRSHYHHYHAPPPRTGVHFGFSVR